MPSYYCPDLDASTKELILEGEEFHHLSRVKRIKVGQSIKINNGQGMIAETQLDAMSKNEAVLVVKDYISVVMPRPRLAIAFALLKNHHDELLVEKCTELGAADFFPLVTDFTIKEEGKNTLSRLKKISMAAIKQCDNPWLPQVHKVMPVPEALGKIRADGYLPVLCSEREVKQRMKDLQPGLDICFIIGPEGGFSDREFELLGDLKQISLSALISRAETAAIAAAAQFQALFRE